MHGVKQCPIVVYLKETLILCRLTFLLAQTKSKTAPTDTGGTVVATNIKAAMATNPQPNT